MKKKRGRRIAMLLAMMMLIMNLIVSPVWAGPGDVEINATNFPDGKFRAYVVTLDVDGDGKLSDTEIAGITAINVRNENIADLTGIKYFTALQTLTCSYNKLSTLDISKNPALKELYCNNNILTTLDLSNNPALRELDCTKNNLTNLDVSNNPALVNLSCDKNKLTNLDVSNNPALVNLSCDENKLTHLDMSNSPALVSLHCYYNEISTLDVSNNPALKYLTCFGNPLTNLDLSNNSALVKLTCYACGLTNLDVSNSPALEYLQCYANQLTNLDLSNNPALEYLHCGSSQLTNLDLSKNTALKSLYCDENELTNLDLSKNTALKSLGCSGNELTKLDVSKNTALRYLHCYSNHLTSLNLVNNTEINDFHGGYQTYDVKVKTSDLKINYADFPDNFESAQVLNLIGATLEADGFKVDNAKPTQVTYDYATGLDSEELNVTLNITYVCTVTFNTNGGTAINPQTITAGGHVTKPTDPTKDGYTFAGWYKDAGLTTPFDFVNETINTDITLYAKWTQNAPTSYTVTFNTNGGSAVASQTITAGGHVTKPTDPTKDGYTFAGWYKDAEFTTPFDFVNETINTDTTIYAKWTEKTPPAPVTYTLTASVEGGHGSVTPTNATKNKNETVTLTFTPETGYELDTVTVNGTAVGVMGNVLDVTMNENKTVIVKFKAVGTPPIGTPVTITFDKNGGTGTMADVTKNKGESFTLPACTFTPPVGKEFKAWQVDGTEKNVGDNIVLNGDKIIKAVWKDIGSLPPTPPVPPTPPTPNPWIVYPGYWYNEIEAPKAKEKPVNSIEIDWKLELTIGIDVLNREINGVQSKIKMDIAPYIKEGRTMLPVRYVAEALGFNVDWNESTRTVILKEGSTRVEIPVDTNQIIVNGKVYTSDVKPEVKNNRTMLSIANIARALGLKDGKDIIWNSDSKMVTIYRTIVVE